MQFEEIVENWFAHNGGGLCLPDGWFGRPYDNVHKLSEITVVSEDEIVVVLDSGKLSLHFEGISGIQIDEQDLLLGPFRKLCFKWRHYDNDAIQESRIYTSGHVRFVR